MRERIRNEALNIRISAETKENLKVMSDDLGVSMSTMVEFLVKAAKIKDRQTIVKEYAEYLISDK